MENNKRKVFKRKEGTLRDLLDMFPNADKEIIEEIYENFKGDFEKALD